MQMPGESDALGLENRTGSNQIAEDLTLSPPRYPWFLVLSSVPCVKNIAQELVQSNTGAFCFGTDGLTLTTCLTY